MGRLLVNRPGAHHRAVGCTLDEGVGDAGANFVLLERASDDGDHLFLQRSSHPFAHTVKIAPNETYWLEVRSSGTHAVKNKTVIW